jgi:hypothetical protein
VNGLTKMFLAFVNVTVFYLCVLVFLLNFSSFTLAEKIIIGLLTAGFNSLASIVTHQKG